MFKLINLIVLWIYTQSEFDTCNMFQKVGTGETKDSCGMVKKKTKKKTFHRWAGWWVSGDGIMMRKKGTFTSRDGMGSPTYNSSTMLHSFLTYTCTSSSTIHIIKRLKETREIVAIVEGKAKNQHWIPVNFEPSDWTAIKTDIYFMSLGNISENSCCETQFIAASTNAKQKPRINNIQKRHLSLS